MDITTKARVEPLTCLRSTCCWIMTSSIGAHTTPEITPPVRAAVKISASVSLRGVPPVITVVTAAVSGNWRPLSTDMLMRLMV